MLEFQHVSKTFKNQEVLHDINMEIHDGEFVVLIGPSGCGKTTSLKMINRLIAPSKGQILLNGSDIRNEDVIRLRRNMGYVIQQTGLFPHMNIEDNMEVIAKLEHVEQAQRRARTRELMEMVGLDYAEFSQRYPQELSGGQQQRVGVARAFALDPDIILMDEPSMGLSPILVNEIFDIIKEVSESGTTVLLVEQNAKKALSIADRAYVLETGSITLEGKADDLLHDESVQKAYLGE